MNNLPFAKQYAKHSMYDTSKHPYCQLWYSLSRDEKLRFLTVTGWLTQVGKTLKGWSWNVNPSYLFLQSVMLLFNFVWLFCLERCKSWKRIIASPLQEMVCPHTHMLYVKLCRGISILKWMVVSITFSSCIFSNVLSDW